MPNDNSPVEPPRKKPNVLWWLAGVFVLLVFLFCLQLFGPNPPIIVSKQTTYITEPLGPDALPDYEKYVLDLYRDGVTPENNAAVLIWQALWPGELDPPQYAAVAQELGLDHVPLEEDALEPVYESNRKPLRAWLKQKGVPTENDQVDEVILDAGRQPWTSEALPPLADWVQRNKVPLDMIVAASHRPRCYFPSPSLLDNERELLIATLLPGVQSAREGGRSLPVRAMMHLGEGRHDEAWQDLLATHRLGRLVAQGHTLVEILVGIAIDGIATEGTLTLLDHGKLTPEQARQIQTNLAALPRFANMPQALDQMERLSALDAVTLSSSRGMDAFTEFVGDGGDDPWTPFLNTVSIDWNVALREINRWYDRIATATQDPDRQARDNSIARIYGDLQQLESQIRLPTTLGGGVVSRSQRSQIVASAVIALFVPAIEAAMNAQDRANTKLDLVRLAAALAVYRAEHNAYPEKLDDLVPNVIDKLPVDLFHAKPFIYKRTADGYLLYSAGENGIDDLGSNEQMSIMEGRAFDDIKSIPAEEATKKMPAGADDHSIRFPRPAFELPQPTPTDDPSAARE